MSKSRGRGLFFGIAVAASGIAIFAQVYAAQGLLPPIAAEMRIAPSTAAITMSATMLGIAAGAIPWAILSEQIGRIPVLRLCMLAAAILSIASAFSPDFTTLVVLRLLTGIAVGGLPGLVVSLITEQASPGLVVRMFGVYIGGTTLGGLSGRVLGSLIGETWGWRPGLAAAGVVSALCAGVFLVWTARASSRGASAHLVERGSMRRIWRPALLALYAQAALLMGSFISILNYLPFHATRAPIDVPPELVFLFFFAHLASWPATPITEALVARVGDRGALLALQGGMLLGFACTLVDHLAFLSVGLALLSVGFFGAHATASRMTAEAAGASRALASAVYVICYYLGASVFGWFSGIVFERADWGAMVLADAALIVVAAAILAAWAVLHERRRPKPAREDEPLPE